MKTALIRQSNLYLKLRERLPILIASELMIGDNVEKDYYLEISREFRLQKL